jgi:drug/metabolite transporter (DMT)-like permease
MLTALVGVVVIALGEGQSQATGAVGVLSGLAVAACFAIQSVALRRYRALNMEPALFLGGC